VGRQEGMNACSRARCAGRCRGPAVARKHRARVRTAARLHADPGPPARVDSSVLRSRHSVGVAGLWVPEWAAVSRCARNAPRPAHAQVPAHSICPRAACAQAQGRGGRRRGERGLCPFSCAEARHARARAAHVPRSSGTRAALTGTQSTWMCTAIPRSLGRCVVATADSGRRAGL
jgi:hypothetical protein